MKRKELWSGLLLSGLFGLWTWLVQTVDVQPVGVNGTSVGLAVLNGWFHQWTGVHWWLYSVTDWLGLVPVGVGLFFALMGAVQLVKRKSLRNVDGDLILLGVHYVLVLAAYVGFETVLINYRPVLIEGRMESSYPSSTTLLLLGVMPTLAEQFRRRRGKSTGRRAVTGLTWVFSVSMTAGRLISGVHWLTDIVGAVLLSGALFHFYLAALKWHGKRKGGSSVGVS